MSAEKEVRALPFPSGEVRAEGRGIQGTASVFGVKYGVGTFDEVIVPGAFDGVLGDDVRALWNHDVNYPLARSASGTLKLWADERALHYDIPNLPTSREDVLESIRRGDVGGSSFSFTLEPDDETWSKQDGGRPLRTIRRIARLFDVGPVVFAASPATTVAARAEKRSREVAAWTAAQEIAAARARLEAEAAMGGDVLTLEKARRIQGEAEALLEIESRHAEREQRRRLRDWIRRARKPAVDRVALHEAGHVVVGWLQGGEVRGARLVFDDTTGQLLGGRADVRGVPNAIFNMAGVAAETTRYSERPETWRSDLEASKAEPGGSPSLARERADDDLLDHWGAVEAVATALGARGELGGHEIVALIEEHTTERQRADARRLRRIREGRTA